MPHRIAATFEVTTPLFLGGANPAHKAELRAPSVKGALRFWWRALAWSRYNGNLECIRKKEACLFGAGGDRPSAGRQSSFGLRARWLSKPSCSFKLDGSRTGQSREGVSYLGYGLEGGGGQNKLARPCYGHGGRFELELRSRRPGAEVAPSIVEALTIFGLLGGLGARSRRGWGSVTLLTLDCRDAPQEPSTLEDYKWRLAERLSSSSKAGEPPFSAFSRNTRLVVLEGGDDPLQTLNMLGHRFKDFRRENKSCMFGLPHRLHRVNEERRASPLLFHVHNIGGKYAIALTFLQAPFLPGRHTGDYGPVRRFIESLLEDRSSTSLVVLDQADVRR